MREMKRILVVKAMVLGAIACSISATGIAADINTQRAQDITNTQQNIQGTEKHDVVQSNWMDRTDIKVGTQSKMGKQISVETLQPLTHYDENSKSVLFVQGGIGRGGQEHSVSYYHGYNEIWYPYNSATGKGDQRYRAEKYENTKSLGTVANAGLGYRHLSKNEHAYVGLNAFVDRAFSENINRVSGGVEYVSGLNEVRANVYSGLGNENSESYLVRLSPDYFTFDLHGGPANYTVFKTQKAMSGYDISYARTFKHARWARAYADYYNWRGRSAMRVGYEILNKRDAIKGFKVGAEFHITPHLTLDAGYKTASHHLSGPYATLKYTIGTSKFAWHGGKHSESAITTARAKMLDKVHRSEMVVQEIMEENYDHGVTDVGL